ncbi:hypothetical protein [Actinomadura sp. 9N215]|uniref:hypothetical protein n=1 Tax=Actinomadura sp. 9N215 TaxID=3375150 RepID=UPI0037A4EF44
MACFFQGGGQFGDALLVNVSQFGQVRGGLGADSVGFGLRFGFALAGLSDRVVGVLYGLGGSLFCPMAGLLGLLAGLVGCVALGGEFCSGLARLLGGFFGLVAALGLAGESFLGLRNLLGRLGADGLDLDFGGFGVGDVFHRGLELGEVVGQRGREGLHLVSNP